MTTAQSPGKMILAGEHAILAGCPAITMATTPLVTCTCEPTSSDKISLQLPGQEPLHYTPKDVLQRDEGLTKRHAQGLAPKCPEDVLLSAVARHSSNWTGSITFTTDLPIGSGMGASAAFLLSLLKALNPSFSTQDLYAHALELEHLQHGTSSGIDVWTSLQGGLWWIERQERAAIQVPELPDFRIVHTGIPQATTGECVNQVKKNFPTGHALWKEFSRILHDTRSAIEAGDSETWSETIRENHRLLCEIGVVPKAIQHEISKIEAQGGSAKICGAGSISGDQAGIVLVRDIDGDAIPEHWSDIEAKFCTVGTSS